MADITGKQKQKARKRRHLRVRKHMSGSSERPRLNVFRSLRHIYAQVIDDDKGVTLASASTIDTEIATQVVGKSKAEAAKIVGQAVAERAKNAGNRISCV